MLTTARCHLPPTQQIGRRSLTATPIPIASKLTNPEDAQTINSPSHLCGWSQVSCSFAFFVYQFISYRFIDLMYKMPL